MYDLIIIGGGPAGLTAAVYAVRKRLDVLMITKDLGGKTNYRLQLPWVERHQIINGEEVVNRFASEIDYLSSVRLLDKVVQVEKLDDGAFRVHTRGEETFEARALLVATGARGQLLNVPGEIEFMMRGLCYSAMSYAPVCIDRNTVVIGEGELALKAVVELARVAAHVTLIAATHGELDTQLGVRVRAMPNVLILEGYQVTEVLPDHNFRYARALIVTDGEDTREIPMDAGFVELALLPNVSMVEGLVDLDDNGRVVIDSHNRTSCPGIFAAGDVSNVYAEQVLIAVGEGAKAALSAYDYLMELPLEEKALAGEWR
ncbi:MAG: FAD-dependent oxidoreductase [Chloroflexi bacterium]|nr:FAD-dependent oxidoreductase [Chloroflexota bacterium]